MNDEELLEWYKKNNGAKPEGMSDKDYELNMNKALKLQQDNVLAQNYKNQQTNIEKAKNNALQDADISNEKLMKYLGQAQLSSGVAKGQTGSDFINANNSYITNRSNIINNAASKQEELLNSYSADKIANESQTYNNKVSILDKYKQEAINNQDKAYDEIMTIINSQSFNTVSELNSLYNRYKDNLSDSQKTMVEHAINYYRNNPQQQELEKSYSDDYVSNKDVLAGKEYVSYDGNDFQIKEQLDRSDEDASEMLYKMVKGELGVNNPYDKSIENGTSISVKDYLINEFNDNSIGDDVTKHLPDWLKNITMYWPYEKYKNSYLTYYDGEWYSSEKR